MRTGILVALSALSWPAQAQAPDCDALYSLPAARKLSREVSVYIGAPRGAEHLTQSYMLRFARAIAAAFKRPSNHNWSGFQVAFVPGTTEDRASPVIVGDIAFTLSVEGRVTQREVMATTRSPEMDSALVAALDGASARGLPKPPLRGSDRAIGLHLYVRPTPVPPVSAVLFRVTVPWHTAQKTLLDAQGYGPHAWYALPASSRAEEGFLTVWYVVDERGRALRNTLEILHEDQHSFLEALRAQLFDQPYQPSVVDGCAIPTFVIRRFDFNAPRH